MALPDGSVGNTQISMGQMRTEFRNDSNPILMSQLYKGGALVPATQTTTTSTTTAIPNISGSPVVSSNNFSGNFSTTIGSQLTASATCGASGNVTASGNIVFSIGGANSNAATDEVEVNGGGVMTGGVKIVSSNAVANASGNLTVGTVYETFTATGSGSLPSNWVCTGNSGNCDSGNGSLTTTISSGTNLQIPSGVTSFKFLIFGSCRARLRGDGSGGYEGNAFVSFGNGTGNYNSTGTSTSAINGNVPTGGVGDTEFQFSDMYGAFDV